MLYHPDAGYFGRSRTTTSGVYEGVERPGYARVSRHPPAAFARRASAHLAHGARMFCATPAPPADNFLRRNRPLGPAHPPATVPRPPRAASSTSVT